MAEALTQYKLTILYMLDLANTSLTNTQISDFILGKDYTDYITLMQAIGELSSSGLIQTEQTQINTICSITQPGHDTLRFFPDKISDAIKEDVRNYLQAHHLGAENGSQLCADFYKTTDSGYAVHCELKKGNIPYIDLTIHASTREQAMAICNNWKEQNETLYDYLMDLLVQ